MDVINQLSTNCISLAAEASPCLLLGVIVACLMKTWIPIQILSHHLGAGKPAIIKAALIGTPLPLCSSGVISVATELRRSGASAPVTSSFLVATPETGVDSVSVSYALLEPVFAIYRPMVASVSAIVNAISVSTNNHNAFPSTLENIGCSGEGRSQASYCSSTYSAPKLNWFSKTLSSLKYSITHLVDDIIWWLFVGLVFATLVRTFILTSFLAKYGSRLGAMLMIAISIPMYICATASTPIAAGFIMAGVSLGGNSSIYDGWAGNEYFNLRRDKKK